MNIVSRWISPFNIPTRDNIHRYQCNNPILVFFFCIRRFCCGFISTVNVRLLCVCLRLCIPFPFDVWGRMWNLIYLFLIIVFSSTLRSTKQMCFLTVNYPDIHTWYCRANVNIILLQLPPCALICIILSGQRTKTVLIRLHECAGWSAPLLFAYGKSRFSHDVAHTCII